MNSQCRVSEKFRVVFSHPCKRPLDAFPCRDRTGGDSGCRKGLMQYHCYSDASWRHGRAGFGVIVVVIEGTVTTKVCRYGGILKAASSQDAEIMAMVRALGWVPSDSAGVSHTDVVGLHNVIRRRERCANRKMEAALGLIAELDRTGLEMQYTDRRERASYYRDCHQMAISVLRGAVKKAKKERGKKWWVCRPVG